MTLHIPHHELQNTSWTKWHQGFAVKTFSSSLFSPSSASLIFLGTSLCIVVRGPFHPSVHFLSGRKFGEGGIYPSFHFIAGLTYNQTTIQTHINVSTGRQISPQSRALPIEWIPVHLLLFYLSFCHFRSSLLCLLHFFHCYLGKAPKKNNISSCLALTHFLCAVNQA